MPVAWLATAAGWGNATPAQGVAAGSQPQNSRRRLLALDRGPATSRFRFVCDPILRLLQDGQWRLVDDKLTMAAIREAWEDGYLPVNREIADHVLDELTPQAGETHVLFQGRQLYAAPAYVRARAAKAVLSSFVPVPWPSSGDWQQLPWSMTLGILDGLLACDLVAFGGRDAVHNFLLTCYDFVRGATVDFSNAVVALNGHKTRVRAHSVDGALLVASSPPARAGRRRRVAADPSIDGDNLRGWFSRPLADLQLMDADRRPGPRGNGHARNGGKPLTG